MLEYTFELEYQNKGYKYVCGIDEAGRGPLAGPVVAAAVILPLGVVIDGLDDSKKISEKKREKLYDMIQKEAICVSVGMASEKEIDEINILNATFLAMKRAVENMKISPDYALVDGNQNPRLDIPTTCIIKGDATSPSIAAASIIAKVTRDRLLIELDEKYPEYCFKKHKGYGTKLHYEKIIEHGILPVHRKSFLKTLDKHG